MTESKTHERAKHRTAAVLQASPDFQNVAIEKPTGVQVQTYAGMKEYVADVYAEKITWLTVSPGQELYTLQKVAVEVDGKYHPKSKNDRRDAALAAFGIKTVRIPLDYFKGKSKITDSEILAEVAKVLEPKYEDANAHRAWE